MDAACQTPELAAQAFARVAEAALAQPAASQQQLLQALTPAQPLPSLFAAVPSALGQFAPSLPFAARAPRLHPAAAPETRTGLYCYRCNRSSHWVARECRETTTNEGEPLPANQRTRFAPKAWKLQNGFDKSGYLATDQHRQ